MVLTTAVHTLPPGLLLQLRTPDPGFCEAAAAMRRNSSSVFGLPALLALADIWKLNPWRAPGQAPVSDSCGMAGGNTFEVFNAGACALAVGETVI